MRLDHLLSKEFVLASLLAASVGQGVFGWNILGVCVVGCWGTSALLLFWWWGVVCLVTSGAGLCRVVGVGVGPWWYVENYTVDASICSCMLPLFWGGVWL